MPGDLALLAPHLVFEQLPLRRVFETPNKPIKNVFFLTAGIASVVASTVENKPIEVGIIGREGMSGMAVVMGNHRAPYETYIQVAGEGWRIATENLRDAIDKSTTMRATLLKFVQAFMVQTAHTAIANGRATLEQRLARWALMAHDRLDGNDLPLTHEFLSLMLSVRRAGVTETLQTLESEGVIRSARGMITVIDRPALKRLAGGYYGLPEAELKRLLS